MSNDRKPNTPPSAERILSTLVKLLADQYGVKVTYEIDGKVMHT